MKKFYILLLLTTTTFNLLLAQDVPVLMQGFQNNAFYNPAVAGLNGSSYDFAYQRRWHNLNDAYSIMYGGGQMVLAEGSLGLGVNLFNENIGLLNRLEVSGSAAYHAELNPSSYLSFGLKAAYLQNGLDYNNIEVENKETDRVINSFNGNNTLNRFDVTFGAHLKTAHVDFGLSSNRLLSLLSGNSENEAQNVKFIFPSFFTANTTLRTAPFGDSNSNFEARLNYRQNVNGLKIFDAGAYYIYNKTITIGANYRNNNAFYAIAAFTWQNTIRIAYAHEIFAGNNIYKNLPAEEVVIQYMYDQQDSFGGGSSSGAGFNRGRIGGMGSISPRNNRLFNKSPNRSVSNRSKSIRSNSRKERNNMRKYKGKYKKLLPPSKRKKKGFLFFN